MFLGIPQAAATLLTIIAFYAMDFTLIRRYDKQRQASGSGRSWDFTFFIFCMVAILVLQPILLPILSFRTTQTWGLLIQLIGILVILAALALHIWSRAHLQQYYAERVEVQPEHKNLWGTMHGGAMASLIDSACAELGEVTLFDARDAAEVRRLVRASDVLLCRSTIRVDEELLGSGPVRFVATATSGVEHVDAREVMITDAHSMFHISTPRRLGARAVRSPSLLIMVKPLPVSGFRLLTVNRLAFSGMLSGFVVVI